VKTLDELIGAITVDCYHDDEAVTAFLTVFEEEVAVPAPAMVMGMPVEALAYDCQGDPPGLTARCRSGTAVQWLALRDLVFDPGTPAAWIHAAFRQWLGL
jgi:hypothetical protein